ncbi:MMPL family transporter [Thiohalobacter sp. IOR34]|uniref:efflux RND transporter permease subunit n=1 Tax=Thiohalobacter sp. IOR34 TaxID=3057176 RepID=UPI0025AFFDE2|nr:MMPL family transporter [Thiohalobacter sp. IOR34]WJW76764.1 MMPL family transporter [Thiohalobacter sp. IOR34]
MSRDLAAWLLRWRWPLLLSVLAAALLAGWGAGRLHFTNDYRVFFSQENPQLRAFENLQDTYTKNDNVLFVLAPRSGDVFTRETLAAVEWLTESAWQMPYSIRVDSISNFQYSHAGGEDELVVEDLVQGAASLDDTRIAAIREVALNEPQLLRRLVSASGDVTGVNVTIQLPEIDTIHEVPETVAYARRLAAELEQRYPEIDVYLTGMILMNNAFSEETRRDMSGLVPIMFGVIFVALLLLLRSLSATLVTFLVIVLAIVTAMGLTGWLGIALTPPSATAPTIIATLAVADCVHLLVSFLHNLRYGMDRQAAMLESLRINFQPIFLTSLTTAIGFMSMNFSDAPPFRDLGNIVAMGVAAAFVYSVTLLPALMVVLPVRVRSLPSTEGSEAIDRLAEFVIARRRPLLWGMGLLVLGLVLMVPRNELNDEFVNYFDRSVDFRRSTDFATQHLTGIYTISYSIPAAGPGGISEPDYLQKLEALSNWLRAQPEVIHVNTLSDTMKRLNMNLHGDDPAWYRVPGQRELAAQYLLLYEMSLPYGLDLNNQINVDKSATQLTVTLQSLSTHQLLALEERVQDWFREHAPALRTDGASPSIMFAHIGQRNIRAMLIGTSVALVLISMILIFALRSLRIGLISLIPNLVPAAMAFGLWGLLVGRVGLALSIVTSMTLGIVVDDTVHFLSKYLRARRERGLSSPDAVRYAFHTVGRALWVTTFVLAAGFLVLSRSAFELNAGMGLLTAITILLALLADFLLLPPLLMRLDRNPQRISSRR